jgi:DNA-binding MarR family transcriptional regulator
MRISKSDQGSPRSCPGQQKDPETLPLEELLRHWGNLLWTESVRPLIQQQLQIDLTMSESLILRHLSHRSLTISEVAEYLAITPSAASRAIDRLVRDGFVSRAENPVDRRQKQLHLTARGTDLVQMLGDKFSRGMARLLAGLSSEEQEQFRLLIAHMLANYTRATEVTHTEEKPFHGNDA